MLNVDRRAVFQSRLSGKNIDLGVLSPDPSNYQAVLASMVEIGMLVPQEALDGAYKVNVNFQYDTFATDGGIIELDYEVGDVVGLNTDDVFWLVDKRGDLFVAEAIAQSEADKESVDEAE